MSETGCRIDVWLWRARFAKTRSLAAAMVERGLVRLADKADGLGPIEVGFVGVLVIALFGAEMVHVK